MLLYRVFLHSPTAPVGQSGSATYLHSPQGSGRWDNPHLYDAWYLATSPEGAVGETFGNLLTWTHAMLRHQSGLARAMAIFSAPDDLALFDFDDAGSLARIGMRPSQVVIRNKTYTQSKAAALFEEPPRGEKWAGVKWWSFHRPTWTNVMLWSRSERGAPLTLEHVEDLTMTSTPLVEAARALSRPLSD